MKKDNIKNKVIEEKPYLFEESLFEEAYNKLKEIGIIKAN